LDPESRRKTKFLQVLCFLEPVSVAFVHMGLTDCSPVRHAVGHDDAAFDFKSTSFLDDEPISVNQFRDRTRHMDHHRKPMMFHLLCHIDRGSNDFECWLRITHLNRGTRRSRSEGFAEFQPVITHQHDFFWEQNQNNSDQSDNANLTCPRVIIFMEGVRTMSYQRLSHRYHPFIP
jgi:hypothetical protein